MSCWLCGSRYPLQIGCRSSPVCTKTLASSVRHASLPASSWCHTQGQVHSVSFQAHLLAFLACSGRLTGHAAGTTAPECTIQHRSLISEKMDTYLFVPLKVSLPAQDSSSQLRRPTDAAHPQLGQQMTGPLCFGDVLEVRRGIQRPQLYKRRKLHWGVSKLGAWWRLCGAFASGLHSEFGHHAGRPLIH